MSSPAAAAATTPTPTTTDTDTDSVFEGELADAIPVVHCSFGGTRIIGRTCVANRHGLLLPNTCTDKEMLHIRSSL